VSISSNPINYVIVDGYLLKIMFCKLTAFGGMCAIQVRFRTLHWAYSISAQRPDNISNHHNVTTHLAT